MKTIRYKTDENLSVISITGLSKDVFNSDENIELLVQSIDIKGKMKFELINENNKVLHDFKSNIATIKIIGNRNYIVELKHDSESDPAHNQVNTNQTNVLYNLNGKFRPTLISY